MPQRGATTDFTRAHYSSDEWGCDVDFDGDYVYQNTFIFVHPANGMYCDIEVETRCGDFDLIAFLTMWKPMIVQCQIIHSIHNTPVR